MISRDLESSDSLDTFHEDELLLRRCLLGDEKAWSILVRKYADLVFSIPIRRGIREEDAADVFQSVWVALLDSIATIREPRAVAAWLIRTTAHACDKLQLHQQRWTAINREHERTAKTADT